MSGRHEHRYSYSSEESGNRHEEENQLVPVVNNNQALVPMYQKHVAPPGTYVVQIPKDQIYRIPPPENARRFENYTRKGKKKSGPSCCCCGLFWIIGILLFLGFLAVIASGIFYIVLRPKALQYSVESFSIKGLDGNLTLPSSSSSLKLSPEFNVTVKSKNPNGQISFYYYMEGSEVTVSYSDVKLSTGTFETFYQPTKNAKVIEMALKSNNGVKMSNETRISLMDHQELGNIPFELDLNVPVKVKVGSIKTWTMTLKVHCDVSKNGLKVNSALVSSKCGVKAKALG
ncbi:NDR1/HIN1-like protein 13 [Papaver somniferum]|uniref:NDR1/HIN1-like protein 13 n=1 Tax=Papaver somniferum TaxID=3469 RepID=UPI000E6FBE6C|nr:NDR1/HIN1-like protein 13 [Papaver somniferum]